MSQSQPISNSSARPIDERPLPVEDINLEAFMMMVNIDRAEILDGQLKEQLTFMKSQNDELKKLNEVLNRLRSDRGSGNDESKAPNLTQEEIGLLRAHGVDVPTDTKYEWQSPTESKEQLADARAKISDAITRGLSRGMMASQGGTTVTINGRTLQIPLDPGLSGSRRAELEDNLLRQVYPNAHPVAYEVPKAEKGPDYDRVYIEATKTAIDSLNSTTQLESIRMQSLSDKRDITYKMLSNLLDKFNQTKGTVVGNLKG